MEDKIILKSTELTGIVGKNEMNKLSLVVEENAWNDYRKKYKLHNKTHILLALESIAIKPNNFNIFKVIVIAFTFF